MGNATLYEANLELDRPPSVNAAFRNVRGVGRVKTAEYTRWIRGQLKWLIAQKARPVATPAKVELLIPDAWKADVDNYSKSVLDLLVRAGVIKDDSPRHVRSISITIYDGTTLKVRVKSIFAEAA